MMTLERWRPFSTLERWDPVRTLGEIEADMNRLFDGVLGRSLRPRTRDRIWVPAVDMYETRDELVVTAELPGVNEKEITLSLTGDVLTLKGERTRTAEVKEEEYRRTERYFGKFERNIPLPMPVQADKVKATYRDGLLEARLPKAEEVKPKEIKIEVR